MLAQTREHKKNGEGQTVIAIRLRPGFRKKRSALKTARPGSWRGGIFVDPEVG